MPNVVMEGTMMILDAMEGVSGDELKEENFCSEKSTPCLVTHYQHTGSEDSVLANNIEASVAST